MKENNSPQFSILIPTTGRSDIIKMSIESVLGQTFTDFEIIIGDSSKGQTIRRNILVTNASAIFRFRIQNPFLRLIFRQKRQKGIISYGSMMIIISYLSRSNFFTVSP